MIPDPPDISQAGTLHMLQRVIRMLADSPLPPVFGGSKPCAARLGDPREIVDPAARLIVPLTGVDRHAISVRGQRVDVELAPGQVIFLASNAWTIPFMDTYCDFFGVVFRSPWTVRLIQMRQRALRIYKGTDSAYHTATPVAEPGQHVIEALSALAELGHTGPPAMPLILTLLELVRQQLAEDVPNPPNQRAQHTWRGVEAYLAGHFDREVTRESVASEFDLNPNYLSTLARQVSGHSFREVLEGVRIQQARQLLRTTNMKLARVALLCGFSDVTHFAKAFRRVCGMTPGRFRASVGSPADAPSIKTSHR